MKNTCIPEGRALIGDTEKWLRGFVFAIFACVLAPTSFAQTGPPTPSSCAGTQLLMNNSFEEPEVPNGAPDAAPTFFQFAAGDVPGWTTTDTSNEIELWETGFLTVDSLDGEQHAELNADSPGALTGNGPAASRAEILYFWAHRARSNPNESASLTIRDDAGGETSFGEYSSQLDSWSTFATTHVTNPGATSFTAEHSTELGGSVGNFHDALQACQTYIALNKAEETRQDVDSDGGDSAGDIITYRYTISNPAGNARAVAFIEITDDKIGTVPVSSPDSGDTNSDGFLGPGETWVIDLDYTVIQADINAGQVTNVAFVTAQTSDNFIRSDDQTVTALLIPSLGVGPVVCPAGLSLSNTPGTASSVVFENVIGNSGFALGALSPEGTSPPDPVAAFVNIGNSSLLVLDLGVIVPENSPLVFSLARDNGGAGNNARLEIRTSLESTSFTNVLGEYGDEPTATLGSDAQNVLERFIVAAPAGGVQFLQFDILNADNAFVDGIAYSQICIPGGELQGSKTIAVFDPLGEGLFALPGNDVTYTLTVSNVGDGQTDEDSIFLIDELPPEVVFFNGDADGPGPGLDPVNFAELTATGLDPFVFNDSVRFAGAGPAPISFSACGLVPQPGYDPNIRYICFNPQGAMNAGDPDPSFTLSFRARIQ